MIKCNRCGKMNAAGVMNCQQCGTPLSNKIESGFGPRMGAQEQPELPAWLESLRAGERSAAPISQSSGFSTADLIEEGALPSWMRSQRDESSDNSPMGPQIALQAPAFPVPGPIGEALPQQGIAAQSLIDEKSLPSWMQEGKLSSTPVPPGGINASSLLEQENMPDWMKTLQQQSSPSAVQPARPVQPVQPMQPSQMAQSARPAAPAPSQGFSAHDLIDQQALPAWMTQPNGQSSATRGNSGPVPSVNKGFGTPSNTPANTPGNGQAGFSASSLLDIDALPPWLREAGSEQRANGAAPSPSAQAAPAYQSGSWQAPEQHPSGSWQPSQQYQSGSWQAPEPQSANAWQGMPSASPSMQAQPLQGGLAGSSFIDMNSLPDWLRSAAGQPAGAPQPQPPPAANPVAKPGPLPAPPRVDNVRVPSRPRGDISANGNSEEAANVFASMLGVASAAPQYPSAPPPASPVYQQPGQPQRVPPAPTGNLAGGSMPTAGQGPNNVPGMPPQGYTPGNSGMYGGYAGNPQGNYQPMGSPMTPPGNNASVAPGTSAEQKNKKRGLVEALRDWLFR